MRKKNTKLEQIKRTDKKQFTFDGYVKVGRIRRSIAEIARVKAADIMVNANHFKHIAKYHTAELEVLAMTPLDYVKMVVDNYAQIRSNQGSSLLLVKLNQDRDSDTVSIELLYDNVRNFWEVKTAQPRRDLRNNELLWEVGMKTKRGKTKKNSLTSK